MIFHLGLKANSGEEEKGNFSCDNYTSFAVVPAVLLMKRLFQLKLFFFALCYQTVSEMSPLFLKKKVLFSSQSLVKWRGIYLVWNGIKMSESFPKRHTCPSSSCSETNWKYNFPKIYLECKFTV